ncbi:two-partner secretion domain-containing protein [Pseudomonas indica]|nr:DUF637 domain-containing protein [Pseudomonas indica]
MDVRSPFFQTIALVLSGVLFLNPLVVTAADLAVAAGSGATLTQAGNGVPVVNIAKPNGNGLSHNKFSELNVGQQGLILNNATSATQSTQLGGIILGNANLQGQAAGLILNEVTGGNPSQLKGYTEVAGKSAHVIVANPHGIRCDGCGFLNTPRVTFSTGKPIVENGRLDRFSVDGGEIVIEGAGLNASNIDQFDLITRSARLNAELHAKQLNVITGRNEVKASDLSVTAKTDDGSDKPALAIDSSALGGMYAGAIRLVGTEAGVGVKLAGDMAASGGDIHIDLASGQLTLARAGASRDLRLEAEKIELTDTAYAGRTASVEAEGEVVNRKSLAAGETVSLDGAQVTNQGVIEAGVNPDNTRNAQGDVSLTGQNVRNSGTVIASRQLTVTGTQTLDNQGGTLSGQAGATLNGGALDNRQGQVFSGGTLNVDAGSLDNRNGKMAAQAVDFTLANALSNDAGLIESDTTLAVRAGRLTNAQGTLRALGERGISRFVIGGRFDNGKGLVEIGNAAFSLSSESLNNLDGIVRHFGSQGFSLSLANLGQAGGRFITGSDLHLEADSWTNGSLIQARTLSLAIGTFTQTASGQLLASQSFTGTGNTWVNNGLLASDGAFSLTLGGGLGTLSLTGTLTNHGTLGSGKALTLYVPTLVNENGLIFSGADMTLRVDTFTNRLADVFSLGAIDLAKDDQGNRAARLDNLSGTLESTGDFSLKAAVINNTRAVLVIDDAGKYTARITELPCSGAYGAGDCSGKRNGVWEIVERDKLAVTEASAASNLQAGGNLSLDGDELNNHSSRISAGGTIAGTLKRLENHGVETGEIETRRVFLSERTRHIDSWQDEAERFTARYWYRSPGYNPDNIGGLESALSHFIGRMESEQTRFRTLTPLASGDQTYAGIIQAGDTIGLTASERIDNGVIRPHFTYVAGGSRGAATDGSRFSTPVGINAQLPADLRQQRIDPLALAGLNLPTRPAASHQYLIETHPALTRLKRFLNSDYLLDKLGYDIDRTQKRLGDGFYEQRLIREALVARTGQRFLDGLTSDEALFRYLMDNAIASKEALNLSVGITLTAEQVAALTHDIVWLEEREVLGEKVLVPVLYLAQAKGRLAPTGALIQARDVALISGGDLHNSGTLRARRNLDITGQNLGNSGLMQADEHLQLLATDSIRNAQGGIIAGRDVSAIALTGDILNERSVTTHASTERGYNHREDFADSAARIEAANDLTLGAGRDIRNIGSAVTAGRDLRLDAGRDLLIVAAEEHDRTALQARKRNSRVERIEQHGSDIRAGRDLSAQAGNDLAVSASKVKADGDVGLEAGGDVLIAAAANESHVEAHRKSRHKKVDMERSRITQQAAAIEAGDDLDVKAGNDLTVIASRLDAGGEAYLYAQHDLGLLAAENLDHRLDEKKKKGAWGSKASRKDQITRTTQVGSEIVSGDDLTLASEGDQTYQATHLQSGADLTLDSGSAIVFEGVKDSEQQVHEKSRSSWAWNATKGKGNTDETLRQSELIAQGALIVKAAEGIRIDIKQVNQQTVSQTIDAMVKADPQLAWLKQAEARGDVDWRRVKEIHESFKYSHSGLGAGAQLIIAIVMAAIIGPMAAGLGAVGQAVTVSVATQATVSTINNRGNLGAVAKDVTSSNAMKGYVVSAATAGLVQYNPAELGMNWSSVGQVATKTVVDAGIKTAVYGGSFKDNLGDAAVGNAVAIAGAIGADAIGDYVPKGSPQKLILHAALGGLLAEASGGDFRTGALAAGANEALVDYLGEKLLPQGKDPNSAEYRQGVANLMASSQLIGVLAAVLTGGDAESAAAVTANATQYNYLLHQEVLDMLEEQKKCSTPACRDDVRARYAELDEQRNQELAATCQQDITSCETLSAQLQADAPKIQALADKLRRSGDGNTASVIGWLVPGSNQMAQDIITSSIVAQRDGPAASAMATGAQIIASGVGGVKPGVSVGAKSNSSSAILGNKTVAQFEKSLSTLPPGERVAQIKAVVASVTIANGMVKDSKLSRLNGRDVYRANDGNLYAVDTQHGRFEVINSKNGKHLGEVDFDFKQTKPADKSGGHDLKVK